MKWIYKGILEKISILAKRKGIEIKKINPAYTSVIGSLKYAPQYSLDKDIAGAYVIGRRGLGYKDIVPENYIKLIENEKFIEYAIKELEEEKENTYERIREKTNKYKKKPLKRNMYTINKGIKLIKGFQSSNGKPQTQQPVNQWKEQVRGYRRDSYKLWGKSLG